MNDPRPSPAVEAPKPIARKPSTVRRMAFMLIAAGVVFGGVFAVKAMMDKGMNDFFDNQSQPAVAVSAVALDANVIPAAPTDAPAAL